MESVDMCDVKKYYNIYDELKKLKPEVGNGSRK